MIFDLAGMPPGSGVPWMPFMFIFFKRLLDAEYVDIYRSNEISISIGGVETAPAFLLITEKGRAFVQELGLHEL